jgi:glycosyltransferase involved in cell wall biosynthesis
MLLAQEILPLVRRAVPHAELVIAGRDPRPELLAAADLRAGVRVTGALDDLRPEFEQATVYCAPLRFASGVQNKVLEAMAMHVPCVTTPAVAGGLEIDGQTAPVEVGSTTAELSAAVVRLLGDTPERQRRAAAGRRFVEEHFRWERSVARLEELCRRAAAGVGPAA